MRSFLLLAYTANLASASDPVVPVTTSYSTCSTAELENNRIILLNECSNSILGSSQITQCFLPSDPNAPILIITSQYSKGNCTGIITSSTMLTNVSTQSAFLHCPISV